MEPRTWDGVVGIATNYWLDDPRFESRQGQKIFHFSRTSKPAVGSTQPSVQWAPAVLSGLKWQGREADHTSPSGAEVKNEWSCLNGTRRRRRCYLYRGNVRRFESRPKERLDQICMLRHGTALANVICTRYLVAGFATFRIFALREEWGSGRRCT